MPENKTIQGKTLEEWYAEGQLNNSRPGNHVHPKLESKDLPTIADEFRAFALSMSDAEADNAGDIIGYHMMQQSQQQSPIASILASLFGPDSSN